MATSICCDSIVRSSPRSARTSRHNSITSFDFLNRFLLRLALGDAAGDRRAFDDPDAVFVAIEGDGEFHPSAPSPRDDKSNRKVSNCFKPLGFDRHLLNGLHLHTESELFEFFRKLVTIK